MMRITRKQTTNQTKKKKKLEDPLADNHHNTEVKIKLLSSGKNEERERKNPTHQRRKQTMYKHDEDDHHHHNNFRIFSSHGFSSSSCSPFNDRQISSSPSYLFFLNFITKNENGIIEIKADFLVLMQFIIIHIFFFMFLFD